MLNPNRNIAALARNGFSSYSDDNVGDVDPLTIDKLLDLSYVKGTPMWTNKGHWETYNRKDYSLQHFLEEEDSPPRSDFCCVFYLGDNPRTMFSGSLTEDTDAQKKTASIIRKNVLIRGGSIFPDRLNASNGGRYVSNIGNFAVIGASAFVAAEGFKESLNGGGVLMSIPEALYERLGSNGYLLVPLAAMAIIATAVRGGYELGAYLGRKADGSRVKGLPAEARDYLYGAEAIEAIEKEHDIFTEEQKKIRLYSDFTKAGKSMIKQEFLSKYRCLFCDGQ